MKPIAIRRRATATGSITAATAPKGQHELVCRKAASLAATSTSCSTATRWREGKDFFSLGDAVHSPDHRLLAFSCDERGNELHRIRWRDLATRRTRRGRRREQRRNHRLDLRFPRLSLYARWTTTSAPSEVFLHRLGADPATDRLVLAETRSRLVRAPARRAVAPRCDRQGQRPRLRRNAGWSISTGRNSAARSSCRAAPGLRYDVEPGRDRLFMRTNADGAFDYKLVSTPLDAIDCGEWREEVPHRPGRMIFNATVFAD